MKPEKTHTYSETEKELKERDALLETIRHQEALINGVPDTIWSIDTQMRLITANHLFIERVKMATGKTIKQGDNVLIKEFGEERLKKWQRYYERALSGEPFTIKEEFYDPVQQTTHYSQISLNPIFDEKNIPVGIVCYSKDITPDSLNLLALESTKERLEKIMDSSLDMICTVSEDDIILSVSAASEMILGYKPEELVGKRLFDFICPEDLERTKKMAASVMSGIDMTNNENRYVRKDGTLVPLMWSASWDPKDRIRYGIARDATERKKIEDALRVSNERFEYAAKATSDILWDWNLVTNEVYYSENMKNLFGHKGGYTDDNLPFYFEHVHPDDRERVVLYPDQVKYGTMVNWSQEYRFRKADGEYAFLLDRGIVIRNEQGVGIRMIGAMQDITAIKQNELRILDQNQRLMEIAMINSHEIRRPVASILGLMQLFNRNTTRNATDQELLKHLETATRELDEVIKRIIDKTAD